MKVKPITYLLFFMGLKKANHLPHNYIYYLLEILNIEFMTFWPKKKFMTLVSTKSIGYLIILCSLYIDSHYIIATKTPCPYIFMCSLNFSLFGVYFDQSLFGIWTILFVFLLKSASTFALLGNL